MADAKLVFHPAQDLVVQNGLRWNIGVIHVQDASGAVLDHVLAAGGPPKAFMDGKYKAVPTPPGEYLLGPKRHHTTSTWPSAMIPYGAKLRVVKQGVDWEVEYQTANGTWTVATGAKSAITMGFYNLAKARGQNKSFNDIMVTWRELLLDSRTSPPGLVLDTYMLNDFGEWAWRLMKDGRETPFFVHTTAATELNPEALLTFSHGCIHILPKDRDRLMQKGYLRDEAGVPFEVRPYGEPDTDLGPAIRKQIEAYLGKK